MHADIPAMIGLLSTRGARRVFTRDDITYEPIDLPDRMDLSPERSLQEARAFYGRMRQRHTVRDYTGAPVAREVIEACIRTAGSAPSCLLYTSPSPRDA